MSRKLITKILIGLFIILVISQFIRPSRKTPRVDPNSTFVPLANPPAEIAGLVKTACYDCHSYETKYPWYANIAPVSWLISNHVNEGREHLNFSDWGKYPIKKKIHKAEECVEEIAEGHMPIAGYTWMHADAQLSKAQRDALVAYFEELKTVLGSIPSMPMPTPEGAPMLTPPSQ